MTLVAGAPPDNRFESFKLGHYTRNTSGEWITAGGPVRSPRFPRVPAWIISARVT
jgi:hypothetical protein